MLRGPDGETISPLALDTGATYTIISWKVARLLGYDPARSAQRVPVTTGSGMAYPPRIVVEECQALDLSRSAFPLLVHTLPPTAAVDGVLGLDFLRGHRLVVDLREGFASLE